MVHFLCLFLAVLTLITFESATGSSGIPRGGDCLERETGCARSLVCVGTETRKRCVRPMPAGKPCDVDPYWVCAPNLVCESNVCKIPKGRRCVGNETSCVSGTICAGTDTRKRCVKPMPTCGRCGVDPWWVCRGRLVCENNICKIRMNGACNYPGSCCVDGTACVGPEHQKRCSKPMPKGGRCGADPWWVCDEGLMCMNGVCAHSD